MIGKYDDMLYLSHPEPKNHPRMSMEKRAAQFAPFAALTGFDGIIEEKARETEERIILSETAKEQLDRVIQEAREQLEQGEAVDLKLRYFQPDARKAGGSYLEFEGRLKRIDSIGKILVFYGDRQFLIEDIAKIEIISA